MWRTLASRIYVCIAVTLTLAMIVSIAAIAGLRRTAATLARTLDDNLPSVVAAGELENALLEQRGYITSFIVSNKDEHWLDEFRQKTAEFRKWLKVAEEVAFTEEERALLAELTSIANQFDATRQKVIELIRADRIDEAKSLMFGEAGELYREAYLRCDALTETNQRLMREESRRAVVTVDWISTGLIVAIIGQLAVTGLLMMTLYRGVLQPLRQMATDLRHYVPSREQATPELRDEVESVANYLRMLLTNVEDFQSTLKTQRQALTDAQKLASVGRLAASLAHEIRNPLTAMKMWLFTARDTVTEGTEVAQTLDCVSQEVRRLEAIVRQFLEFSRPSETRLTWAATDGLIANSAALVEPLLREKSITLSQHFATDLPELFVDQEQMKQVIVNLLRNAAESLPPSGQIAISTAKQTDPDGRTQAVLRISDNGPGISGDLHAKVFEPFFTTKYEGTGLGLAIVSSIVLRHGGHVELEPATENGAVFVVYLPLPEEANEV